MKKVTLTIQYDETKLNTLKPYLEKKKITIQDSVANFLDVLYLKNVPVQVREFFAMQSGDEPIKPRQKPKTDGKKTVKENSDETNTDNTLS